MSTTQSTTQSTTHSSTKTLKELSEEYEKFYNNQDENGRSLKHNICRSEKLLAELIEKYLKPYQELEKQFSAGQTEVMKLIDSGTPISNTQKEKLAQLESDLEKIAADFNIICPFMYPSMLAREWFMEYLITHEIYLTPAEKQYRGQLECEMKFIVNAMNSRLLICAFCQKEVYQFKITFLYGVVQIDKVPCQCSKNKPVEQIAGRVYRGRQHSIRYTNIYVDPLD